jgi:NADPH-dependent 2,4-dienoyl-CoA reductase/sulfur reductase-like enzyme
LKVTTALDRYRFTSGAPANSRDRSARGANLLDAGRCPGHCCLAKPGSRVLQLGAGFIGCIIMEALVNRGVQLTVVEMGDRMVPRMMTPEAGSMIKRWVEKQGVRVVTKAGVERIEKGEQSPLTVTLSTGEAT